MKTFGKFGMLSKAGKRREKSLILLKRGMEN